MCEKHSSASETSACLSMVHMSAGCVLYYLSQVRNASSRITTVIKSGIFRRLRDWLKEACSSHDDVDVAD